MWTFPIDSQFCVIINKMWENGSQLGHRVVFWPGPSLPKSWINVLQFRMQAFQTRKPTQKNLNDEKFLLQKRKKKDKKRDMKTHKPKHTPEQKTSFYSLGTILQWGINLISFWNLILCIFLIIILRIKGTYLSQLPDEIWSYRNLIKHFCLFPLTNFSTHFFATSEGGGVLGALAIFLNQFPRIVLINGVFVWGEQLKSGLPKLNLFSDLDHPPPPPRTWPMIDWRLILSRIRIYQYFFLFLSQCCEVTQGAGGTDSNTQNNDCCWFLQKAGNFFAFWARKPTSQSSWDPSHEWVICSVQNLQEAGEIRETPPDQTQSSVPAKHPGHFCERKTKRKLRLTLSEQCLICWCKKTQTNKHMDWRNR